MCVCGGGGVACVCASGVNAVVVVESFFDANEQYKYKRVTFNPFSLPVSVSSSDSLLAALLLFFSQLLHSAAFSV